MPWKASSVMDERLRSVARLLDGEAMTDVCREFGVSRKTRYKIFDRYKEHVLTALSAPVAPTGALRQPMSPGRTRDLLAEGKELASNRLPVGQRSRRIPQRTTARRAGRT
jgi:transposase-like protein